jgi:hypothetical protein
MHFLVIVCYLVRFQVKLSKKRVFKLPQITLSFVARLEHFQRQFFQTQLKDAMRTCMVSEPSPKVKIQFTCSNHLSAAYMWQCHVITVLLYCTAKYLFVRSNARRCRRVAGCRRNYPRRRPQGTDFKTMHSAGGDAYMMDKRGRTSGLSPCIFCLGVHLFVLVTTHNVRYDDDDNHTMSSCIMHKVMTLTGLKDCKADLKTGLAILLRKSTQSCSITPSRSAKLYMSAAARASSHLAREG